MKINSVSKVEPSEAGIHLHVQGVEVFLAWGVIDQIAEASEDHYSTKAVLDFMSSLNQRPN